MYNLYNNIYHLYLDFSFHITFYLSSIIPEIIKKKEV